MISTLVNAIHTTINKQNEAVGDGLSLEQRSKPVSQATLQAFHNTCAYLKMRRQDSLNTEVGRWKELVL
jgi:hypothetical protein